MTERERGSTNDEFLNEIANVVAKHLARPDRTRTTFGVTSYSIAEDNIGGTEANFVFEVDYGEPTMEKACK